MHLLTTLTGYLGINKRFIMLANKFRWQDDTKGFVGRLTCDSDDYYNSGQNMNAILIC